jgi:hypothetical protein
MLGAQQVHVAVALYIYIGDVLGSTLGKDNDYAHCVYSLFYPSHMQG